MKGLRLILILVGAALVVASPAPASAAVWKHGGSNVNKFTEIDFGGAESFGVIGIVGTINCELSGKLTTSGGSTGTITKYTLFACSGTGGLANCVPVAVESKGLPWTVDVNTTDLTLTKMRTRRTFTGKGCPASETDVTWSPTLTLDTPTAIYEMEFFIQSALYASAGVLQLIPPDDGTYGIG